MSAESERKLFFEAKSPTELNGRNTTFDLCKESQYFQPLAKQNGTCNVTVYNQ